MRVRVEFYEPFELVMHTQDLVYVFGEIREEDLSGEEAVIRVIRGNRVGGLELDRLSVGPRHVGSSLTLLEQGESVIVHGTGHPIGDGKPLGFIGRVFPISDLEPGSTPGSEDPSPLA